MTTRMDFLRALVFGGGSGSTPAPEPTDVVDMSYYNDASSGVRTLMYTKADDIGGLTRDVMSDTDSCLKSKYQFNFATNRTQLGNNRNLIAFAEWLTNGPTGVNSKDVYPAATIESGMARITILARAVLEEMSLTLYHGAKIKNVRVYSASSGANAPDNGDDAAYYADGFQKGDGAWNGAVAECYTLSSYLNKNHMTYSNTGNGGTDTNAQRLIVLDVDMSEFFSDTFTSVITHGTAMVGGSGRHIPSPVLARKGKTAPEPSGELTVREFSGAPPQYTGKRAPDPTVTGWDVDLSGCTTVRAYSFMMDYNVWDVSGTDAIEEVGAYAFNQATHMQFTALKLPESLKKIGEFAFAACSDLVAPSLPSSLEDIGERALAGCSNIKIPSLPNGLKSIGRYAFADYMSRSGPQASFTVIPASITSIDAYALAKFPGETLTWKTDVALPTQVLAGVPALKRLDITGSVISIGQQALSSCKQLETVSLPETISVIGAHAFRDCSALTAINFPASLTAVQSMSFSGCSSLPYLYFEGTKPPTLNAAATSIFPGTIPIYVPDEAVAAYKAATNWAVVASRIKGISEKS